MTALLRPMRLPAEMRAAASPVLRRAFAPAPRVARSSQPTQAARKSSRSRRHLLQILEASVAPAARRVRTRSDRETLRRLAVSCGSRGPAATAPASDEVHAEAAANRTYRHTR